MQPIIKNRLVRLETKPQSCGKSKQVQVLEDEGVIRAIEIRCSCGETTVIELEYPDRTPSRSEEPS